MEIGDAGPVLKKIRLRMLEPELQNEIAELAAELGYETTVTSSSSLHFLFRIYQAEKAKEKRSRKALKKAEEMILRLASLHHAAYAREERNARERKTEHFKRLEVLEESSSKTRHENEVAAAYMRKLLTQSLGFWRDVERHFHDKPMVSIIESMLGGGKDSGEKIAPLLEAYFSLPAGADDREALRSVELGLISSHLGPSALKPLPDRIIKAYDLMRSSDSHHQKLAAYLLIRRTAERQDGVDLSVLDNAQLGKISVPKSCILLSIATEKENWVAGLMQTAGVPREQARAMVEDISEYCRGGAHPMLRSAKALGGEGTVVRLDFGEGKVLFFRFGDARSHALGYEILRRYGFPTPQSYELHSSMCNMEKDAEGVSYGDAYSVPKKAAHTLGRLLSACFIFGIPDPNETNFLIRNDDVVKIDAESAISGWNYYSGVFIGGSAKERPNDSYGFSRLMRLKGGTEAGIRAGFLDGVRELQEAFGGKPEIDDLCKFVEKEYFGAYLYRSSGEGLDEKVLGRLRKRLESLLQFTPEELLAKAERGQEIR